MTIEKAIEILEQHPEIIEKCGDIFLKAFDKLSPGEQLDFLLLFLKYARKFIN